MEREQALLAEVRILQGLGQCWSNLRSRRGVGSSGVCVRVCVRACVCVCEHMCMRVAGLEVEVITVNLETNPRVRRGLRSKT